MNKTELLKAIKNGESVWFVDNCNEKVWEIDLNEKYKPEIYLDQTLYVYQNINDRFQLELFIKNIYKTKAEAEHYLHHANVTRTETLPFLTWEEFLEKRNFSFRNMSNYYGYDYYDEILDLYMPPDKVSIRLQYNGETIKKWEATEQNFYKAYDEFVKLFKGE